jgi:micrococcal nuclease
MRKNMNMSTGRSLAKTVILLACLGGAAAAHAQPYWVVGVTDGDTIKLLSNDKVQMICRLHGIDAPEQSQSFGQASKKSLSDLVYRQTVDVEIAGRPSYNRQVCRITLRGVDVGREQIVRGMAWMSRKYTQDASYDAAESNARAHHLGLWQDPAPVAPWDYRHPLRQW